MTRKQKIELLINIQGGRGTIDDLNPYKTVFVDYQSGVKTYNSRVISEKEFKHLQLMGACSIIATPQEMEL